MDEEVREVEDLVWREDLYPRFEPNPVIIQKYADDLELLPAIEINQHNEIIDGYHRWIAHKKGDVSEIQVIVTHTKSDTELLALACERNSKHGLPLTSNEKKSLVLRLYADGTGITEDKIAQILSISPRQVARYLERRKGDLKEKLKEDSFKLWLACWTYEEIGEKLGVSSETARNYMEEYQKSDKCQKFGIFSNYQDPKWKPPLYNVWKQQKKSNEITHPANTEQMILDNLLYMYTEPFDIVVDPFAGGGSTIDICRKRLRRYWVSDRLPIIERLDIRQGDILDGPPSLHKRWSDVALLYLDPPYWIQSKGKFSDDPEDLANMDLETFYKTLQKFVRDCGEKMPHDSHIAMIMGITQWPMPNKEAVDHVFDLMNSITGDPLLYEFRIVCPYESQQYNATQVKWAKDSRRILVLNREIVVWKVGK